jgi:hypothetical protein
MRLTLNFRDALASRQQQLLSELHALQQQQHYRNVEGDAVRIMRRHSGSCCERLEGGDAAE